MEQNLLLGIVIGIDEVIVGNNTLAGGNFWICGPARGIVTHNMSSDGRIFIADGRQLIAEPNLPQVVIADHCEVSEQVKQIIQ